ncbi:MAG TPA: ATP-binding protein [Caulobacteraceae bacterium]|nr:ATP-binding protein [Caulobacteraceae bacterium]
MDTAAETDRRAPSLRRRASARFAWRLFSGVELRGIAPGLLSGVIVAGAAVPFAGWLAPALWLAAISALVVASHVYAGRFRRVGRNPFSDINPFTWLVSAGYSAAALYLVFFFGGAAQTLGVTLYGVIMFQILARDYAAPRRLAANLAAPVLSMLVVQAFAATLLVQHAEPWRIVTLLASPIVVFRAFRAVQANLDKARRQQREALAQLGDSEARYRLLAERSPDVILRYDTTGRIEYVSAAARHYGYEPDALIDRNLAELLDPNDRERNDAFMAALAAGQPTPTGDDNVWRTWAADGRPLAFEGATSVLHDDEGRVIGAMSALRDVTARVALEDELRARRAEAEAANEAKSQFLANMSHEVRTPLTGVVGFARLLEARDDLPDDARAHVARISKSAEALLSVVNDVLDFSKLEAAQLELDPQPFDAPAFLQETIDLVRPQAADKALTVTVTLAPTLPAWLDADAARLRQVLLNLLTNAVKFTARGSIAVAAAYDRGQLRIGVTDTGPGIEPEAAARLFKRFSQVDNSNTRQHGGTGLGLAISKGLVESMGGAIGLESAPGRGSTFWFTVPAPIVDMSGAAAPAQPAEPAPEFDAGRLSILVVDDVAANRELICTMLAPFDVNIATAASGPDAVEAACAQPFDVILMDLQMPGMDGMAATRAIRANSDINRTTPILAISANVLPLQVEAARRAGMDDHIAKPIDPRELLTKVGHWTSQPQPEHAALAATRP